MSKKIAVCFFCRTPEPRADIRAKAVLCSKCVARLSGSPATIGKLPKTEAQRLSSTAPKKRVKKQVVKTVRRVKKTAAPKKVISTSKTSGWGRGWHLKKHFVAPNGAVYSFGNPVTGN